MDSNNLFNLQFKNNKHLNQIQASRGLMIISALSEASHLQSLDIKSRRQLTQLLDEQIDRNEILQTENTRLEQQQRKLIQLLQIRTQQLKKSRVSNSQRSSSLDNKSLNHNSSHGNNSKQQQLLAVKVNSSQKQPDHGECLKQKSSANNDSTALWPQNNTVVMQYSPELLEALKLNLKQKQEEMKNMREYYTKYLQKLQHEKQNIREQCERQMEVQVQKEVSEYQTIVGKQKARIKQLMEVLQKSEEQKSKLQQQLQHMQIARQSSQETQMSIMKQKLSHFESALKQSEKQLQQTIEHYNLERQGIMETHNEELQSMQKNTIYKIQQAQQKCQGQVDVYEGVIKDKDKQIQALQSDVYGLQAKLREQLIRFQQQCEIVINIQASKQELGKKLQMLQEEMQQKKTEIESSKKSSINIDNIHKQYALQLSEKQLELNSQMQLTKQWQNQYNRLQQLHAKSQLKLSQINNKNNIHVYKLQTDIRKYEEDIQSFKEEIQYLTKDNKMKDQDIKRFTNKVAKETQKRQQYVHKLQSKIQQLQAELNELEENVQQKDADVQAYKQQMSNFIQKLKEQISKKQKELSHIQKETEKQQKQWQQSDQLREQGLAVTQNQLQQSLKKYAQVCERLKFMQEQRNNYKHLYDDSLREAKSVQAKRKKLMEENGILENTRQKLQKQVQYLKEQILASNLGENQKEELENLRTQILEHKARANKLNQTILKVKDDNARATRQNLGLEQSLRVMQGQVTKLSNQLNMKKQRIEELEQQMRGLQQDLKERCKQLQTSMPYLNKVIEQKKSTQLELQKKSNQIKKLISLVQMAKKSKAQEIINLNKQVQGTNYKIGQLENEIKQNRQVIERFNREKVNMLRQNTVREDLLKKLERENKKLKDELIQSQENVEKLMHYIGIAGNAMESVELEQSFSKRNQRR